MTDWSLIRLLIIIAIILICFIAATKNIKLMINAKYRNSASKKSRIFWHCLGILIIFCVVDAFYIEPNWVQLTNTSISSQKIQSGKRIRIVHLSDIHMEEYGRREEAMLDLTRQARPDIIILTGDYRHLTRPSDLQILRRLSKQLVEIAPTFAIPGNVDSYRDDMAALSIAGVICININNWEKVELKSGRQILLGHLGMYKINMPEVPNNGKSLYKILLSHWPYEFDAVSKNVNFDLMLAGHLHGGQIRLPLIGALLPFYDVIGKYQAGLYVSNGRKLYVNRGIGLEGSFAPRARFFCRPEVAVIDIEGE